MSWPFVIVTAVAVVVHEVARWAEERENARTQLLTHRRRLRAAANARAQKKLARHGAKEALKKAIASAKAERTQLMVHVQELVLKRRELGGFAPGGDRNDRKTLQEIVFQCDDLIAEKRAHAHRYSLYIDEAIRLKEALFGRLAMKRNRAGQLFAQSIEDEDVFSARDVPVPHRVVRALVRSPQRGLWFALEGAIRGELAPHESFGTLRSGQVCRVWVEDVHFVNRRARVSLEKARFVDAWKQGERVFTAKRLQRVKGGNVAEIHGISAFLPDRFGVPKELAEIRVEILELEPRLRGQPGLSPIVARPAHVLAIAPQRGSGGMQTASAPSNEVPGELASEVPRTTVAPIRASSETPGSTPNRAAHRPKQRTTTVPKREMAINAPVKKTTKTGRQKRSA